ncbi:MAG: hypothetical protein IKY26_01885 [Erysipelotrichaceae bacterium]|nr:hypothetical protein [Erysipelotrichaceae bacterium]
MEFERRITLMNPDFEIKEKITSDTIFSFLNAYTERFIRNNYLQEDTVADGSRAQKKNVDSLKGLVVRGLYSIEDKDENNTDRTTDRVVLPEDYFLYIRSNSLLSKNYKLENEITNEADYVVAPNKTIREDNVDKVISSYYNKAIVLTPYVVLNNGNVEDTDKKLYANIIHDEYTIVKKLDLVYYRKPKKFDVIGVDGLNVLDHCELPENVHMEIVEGAVEMFITEAKYRLNMKQN